MFRWWFSWALALAISISSTAVVVKSAAFPEKSWSSLATAATSHLTHTLILTWSKAFASPPREGQGRPASRSGGNPDTADVRYTLRASLDPVQHRITGEETVEWRQHLPSPWYFYLYPQGTGGIHIQSVKQDGRPLPFEVRGNGLWISPPGTGISRVTIEFVTDVPADSPRYGETGRVWILGYWYPLLAVFDHGHWLTPPTGKGFGEPFLVDSADYRVTWTAPAGMTWFASAPAATSSPPPGDGGTAPSRRPPGGESPVTTVMEGHNLRHFALVGSSKYQEVSLDLPGGPRLRLGLLDIRHRDRLTAVATSALQTFRAHFGPLPYPEVSVVETPPGTTFAQELPNLALIDVDLWNARMPEQDAEHWTAHELAHLWWYNAVGDYEGLTPWLDEGLADFSAYLYREERYGRDSYESAMSRLAQWFKEGRSYSPGHPGEPLPSTALGATDRPYADFNAEWQYYYLEYLRPVLMYRDLRRAMGDDRFFHWLQSLFEENIGRTVTAEKWLQSLRTAAPDQEQRAHRWLTAPNEDLLRRLDGSGYLSDPSGS